MTDNPELEFITNLLDTVVMLPYSAFVWLKSIDSKKPHKNGFKWLYWLYFYIVFIILYLMCRLVISCAMIITLLLLYINFVIYVYITLK